MARFLLFTLLGLLAFPAQAALDVPPPPTGASACTISTIPAGNTVTASAQAANIEVPFTTTCQAAPLGAPYTLKCEFWGVLSVGATVPTLRGRVFINGTPVLDTGGIPGLVTSTNYGWHALFSINIMTIGTSGQVDAQGELRAQIGATADLVIPVRNTTAFTMDTTQPLTISGAATWGNALAGSAIQLRHAWCK